MTDGDVATRAMADADLEHGLALSTAEGWPHTLDDWRASFARGSGVVAETGNRLVGTALWWPLGRHAATIGLVLVAKDARGRGIARQMVEEICARTPGIGLLLNATEMAVGVYLKAGFTPVREVFQYQGMVARDVRRPAEPDGSLRPVRADDVAAIAALDRNATGLDRRHLLTPHCDAGDGSVALRDGGLAGFALHRRFARGRVIGPLIAETRETAHTLLARQLAQHSGTWARIDATARAGMSDELERAGLARAATVITMVRGFVLPDDAAPQVFALHSHAFA